MIKRCTQKAMMLEEFTFGCFVPKHKESVTIGVLYAQKRTEYFGFIEN